MDKVLSKRDANKTEKKGRIIDIAEKLFLQMDFESASMDEIAKESHLTKRTVYQYFDSKEDLFYAVALKGTKDYIANCEEALGTGRNAHEKLCLLNNTYYQFYINHPGMFRIINYQPDNKLNCEASPYYQELNAFKNRIVQLYMDIVKEGQSDGSINAKLNPKYAAYFGLLSSAGLLNLVSSMEASYIWGNEGLSENDFLQFSLDLLADALK